jgi:hypothetical protein
MWVEQLCFARRHAEERRVEIIDARSGEKVPSLDPHLSGCIRMRIAGDLSSHSHPSAEQ